MRKYVDQYKGIYDDIHEYSIQYPNIYMYTSNNIIKRYIKILFDTILCYIDDDIDKYSNISVLLNSILHDSNQQVWYNIYNNTSVADKEKIVCILIYYIASNNTSEMLKKIQRDRDMIDGFNDVLSYVQSIDMLHIKIDSKILNTILGSNMQQDECIQDNNNDNINIDNDNNNNDMREEDNGKIENVKENTHRFDSNDRIYNNKLHLNLDKTYIPNSVQLYRDRYEKIVQKYTYMPKPDIQQLSSSNKKQCSTCHKNIDGILNTFNRGFCYYTYTWNCMDCISHDKMRIPWKVLEEFDLKLYTVSNNVAVELESFYDKPTLELSHSSSIVKKNANISVYIILQRELHLLYDTICRPSIVADLMPNYLNLLLKKNMLSVKNFVEIESGTLLSKMNEWLHQFKDHFEGCDRCSKKGIVCNQCNDIDNKVFIFNIRDSKICKKCSRIYHRVCWNTKGCISCDET